MIYRASIPFRLQFSCNGHSGLARKLTAEGIHFAMADNAFIRIGDLAQAQQLADALRPDDLYRFLDAYVNVCCPVVETFAQTYHWSLRQTKYSTDLAFSSEAALKPIYEQFSRKPTKRQLGRVLISSPLLTKQCYALC